MTRWIWTLHVGQLVILWLGLAGLAAAVVFGGEHLRKGAADSALRAAVSEFPVVSEDQKRAWVDEQMRPYMKSDSIFEAGRPLLEELARTRPRGAEKEARDAERLLRERPSSRRAEVRQALQHQADSVAAAMGVRRDSVYRAHSMVGATALTWLSATLGVGFLLGIPVTAWFWFGARPRSRETAG